MSLQTKAQPIWEDLNDKTTKVTDDERRAFVIKALDDHDGNIMQTAKSLDISRSYLSRFVKKFELAAYAAELRIKAGATSSMGRPRRES